MQKRSTSCERRALPVPARREAAAGRGERGSRIALLVFLFGVLLVVSSIRPVTPPATVSRTAIAEPLVPPVQAHTFEVSPTSLGGIEPASLDGLRVLRVFRWGFVPTEPSEEHPVEPRSLPIPLPLPEARPLPDPRILPDPTLTKIPGLAARGARS